MKSKKIIALIVAFASFMAVATSGLAAISTTTTYDFTSKKVNVVANVPADKDSEVTYLVTNSDGDIVYIDQQTAGANGADFTYKIAIDKLPGLTTSVQYGTDGTAINTTDAEGIKIAEFGGVTNANVNVTYYADSTTQTAIEGKAVLTEGTPLYVAITAKEGYVVKSIKIGNETHDSEGRYPVVYGQEIVVETELQVIDPGIEDTVVTETIDFGEGSDDNAEAVEAAENVHTTLIKVSGTPTRVWVEVNGQQYVALTTVGDVNGDPEYVNGGVYAVRIIDKDGTVVDSPVAKFE